MRPVLTSSLASVSSKGRRPLCNQSGTAPCTSGAAPKVAKKESHFISMPRPGAFFRRSVETSQVSPRHPACSSSCMQRLLSSSATRPGDETLSEANVTSAASQIDGPTGNQSMPRERERGSSSSAAAATPLSTSGPGELDGPILADFLAMGAGRAAAPTSRRKPSVVPGVSTLERSGDIVGDAPAAAAEKKFKDTAAAIIRERPLVVAALQPSKVLGQVLLETPPRPALQPPCRSPGQVPEIFLEAHAGYAAKREKSESHGADVEGAKPASSSRPSASNKSPKREANLRSLRLLVMPWHRARMQQIVCKAVFFHFLQDLRVALGLRSGQQPLFVWEAQYANQFLDNGNVIALVKYLAETELHIARGPVRRKIQLEPGWKIGRIGAEETQRLRAERRQLAQTQPVRAVRRRILEEDAILRVFLDGRLCWSSIRTLLIGSPLLPTEDTLGVDE